jgi:hypothetical protein
MPNVGIFKMLFDSGMSREDLQNVLAPNAVLEWFGKTFSGKREIAYFYSGAGYRYEHLLVSAKPVASFETRSTHFST